MTIEEYEEKDYEDQTGCCGCPYFKAGYTDGTWVCTFNWEEDDGEFDINCWNREFES